MVSVNTTITVHTLGVQHGLWCRTCVLPSGIAYWYTIGAAGALREKRQCRDCGGEQVDGDPYAEWLPCE